ncbi:MULTISPECIES: hypothetical protein [unclassified Nocardioides]|uniref:hypothetical protein n=1 Tax=unclassified Nocardioides TaxID=2615069 RepID=UPI000702A1FD|nr:MULTISPECIES: hypothetical protein [unclassified Nocardioides]KQP64973.1 hypothetical protein ASF47_14165 [Nocardioides sp. Leaf285]KQQ43993.1 hypothetical protein ASF50_09210 [Nocardioides sp. Leaf307]
MARRVSLPSADDLFRPTADPTPPQTGDHASPASPEAPDGAPGAPGDDRGAGSAGEPADPADPAAAPRARRGAAKPSGRVRHDEKMTVYITSEELLAIEHARLALRSGHGLAVDRGRLVREAVAMVLADFEADGEDSALVRRLTRE